MPSRATRIAANGATGRSTRHRPATIAAAPAAGRSNSTALAAPTPTTAAPTPTATSGTRRDPDDDHGGDRAEHRARRPGQELRSAEPDQRRGSGGGHGRGGGARRDRDQPEGQCRAVVARAPGEQPGGHLGGHASPRPG